MATREEIVSGIQEVRERLRRLEPRITANPDRPLLTGSWTVWEVLCHLAADGHAAERLRARLDGRGGGPPPSVSGDEYNQQQVDARKTKPFAEVMAEVWEGLDADEAAAREMEDQVLQRPVPTFRGDTVPLSEMLRFYTGRHNQMHLDEVEAALKDA